MLMIPFPSVNLDPIVMPWDLGRLFGPIGVIALIAVVVTLAVIIVEIIAAPTAVASRPSASQWFRHRRSTVKHSKISSIMGTAPAHGPRAAERGATYGDDHAPHQLERRAV
jgi:hypothetical protein